MNDNEQKVIEIIEKFLDNACINGRNVTSYVSLPYAIDLHDRIVPLIRGEFPSIKDFYHLFLKTCNRGFYRREIQPFYDALKRIWEGQDHKEKEYPKHYGGGRKERRISQVCPLGNCNHRVAPFPDGKVGHFFNARSVFRPLEIVTIQHTFTERRK